MQRFEKKESEKQIEWFKWNGFSWELALILFTEALKGTLECETVGVKLG